MLIWSIKINSQVCDDLYIAGIVDGPLTGGVPKMVQVCANSDIPDMSIYGLGSANNGGGTDGIEYTFPSISLDSASCYTVASETTGFNNFFGCPPNVTSGSVNVNGDDAIELFCNGSLSDLYGDVNANGGGLFWEYTDGWAISNDSIPNTNFTQSEWTYSGPNALDGSANNATATIPYPLNTCVNQCSIIGVNAISQTQCDPIDNSFTQTLEITFVNPPASGFLIVNNQQFNISSSPQSITLLGLNSNGQDIDVVISFSDNMNCTNTFQNVFTAPSSCTNNGGPPGLDTIKIMSYNLLNFPNSSNSDPIGSDASRIVIFRNLIDSINPDVIVVQELKSLNGLQLLTNELNNNSALGVNFDYAPIFVAYSGLGNGLIYKSDNINLIAQSEMPRNNSMMAPNGNNVIPPRGNTLYELEISNGDCTDMIPLELISVHFKAGSDSASGNNIADNDNRNLSVLDILDYTEVQGSNANIIVAGDMNFKSDDNTSGGNSEPGYISLSSTSNLYDFIDPLGGFTRNITADASKYTQATRTGGINAYGNGGIPGGLDDRFDFIFIHEAIANNIQNISYINSSYTTPGSPGILNSESCSSGLANCTDFKYMSDHYPVTIELELAFTSCTTPCENIVNITQDFLMNEVDTLQAIQTINADNIIGSNAQILYRAGQEISLQIGFEVQAPSIFEAAIGPCVE